MKANGHPQEESKLTADIRVYCDPHLKALAIEAAKVERIPLSELVARALAEYLDCPQYAAIPRKSFGRPCNVVDLGKGKQPA